jgi:XTP/dITP diphosphohydrolase
MLSSMPPLTLYAATSNPDKLAEFATGANSAGIEVLPLPNLASIPEPIEDAPTFQGNADLKARAYSLTLPNQLGKLVLADDSGLEVFALDGAPGVRSARFADDAGYDLNSTRSRDERNNAYLLKLMQPHASRRARFVCTLALARDGQILLRSEGSVDGELLRAPRGQGGFAYDPLFLLPALGLTMAELPRQQKWQLSHRGNAFRSLLAQIRVADL